MSGFGLLVIERDQPYRFGPLVEALVAARHAVAYLTPTGAAVPGALAARFRGPRPSGEHVHPHVIDTERAVRTGQEVVRAISGLLRGASSASSRTPFELAVHRGEEGTGLFLHEVLPGCRQVAFVDGYFVPLARLADPLPPVLARQQESEAEALLGRSGNVPVLFAATFADAVVCATGAQRAQFPTVLQPRIAVLHLGVDVDRYRPVGDRSRSRAASRELVVAPAPSGGDRPDDLFATLGAVLRERPLARAAVVVDDAAAAPALMAAAAATDEARCLVVVRPTAEERERLLGAATVLLRVGVRAPLEALVLEAMAAGVVVATWTGPAGAEVVRHGVEGFLAAPEPEALASLAGWVFDHAGELDPVRRAARAMVVERYARRAQLQRAIGLLRWTHAGHAPPVRPVDHVPHRHPGPQVPFVATAAGGHRARPQ